VQICFYEQYRLTTNYVHKAILTLKLRSCEVMTSINEFLSNTSAHGFRYLTTGNGLFIRLIWTLALATAFTICFMIIKQNYADNAKYPVATTVEYESVSNFDFPTVTLAQEIHSFDKLNLFENVLNYFTFDCSPAGFENDDVNEARFCSMKSEDVKLFFQDVIYDALFFTFNQSVEKLAGSPEVLDRHASGIICSAGTAHLGTIKNLLVKLLDSGLEEEALRNTLAEVLANLFGMPIWQGVRTIEGKLLQLLSGDQDDITEQECITKIGSLSKGTHAILMSFLKSFENPSKVMGLGSLLRSLPNVENYPSVESVIVNMDEIIMQKMGLENHTSYSDYINCWLQKNCYRGRYNFMRGQTSHSALFNLMSLYLRPTTSGEMDQFHYELAKELAQDLGFQENALLSINVKFQRPLIWHCALNEKMVDPCFQFKHAYSNFGMSTSFIHVNRRGSIAKSTSFIETLPSSHVGHNLEVKSNTEVLIFIDERSDKRFVKMVKTIAFTICLLADFMSSYMISMRWQILERNHRH